MRACQIYIGTIAKTCNRRLCS